LLIADSLAHFYSAIVLFGS